MKIDGKHPIRQAFREAIKTATEHGTVTLTKDQLAQMIIKAEGSVPKKRNPECSWRA